MQKPPKFSKPPQMLLGFLLTAAWPCHFRSPGGTQPSVCPLHCTATWDRHGTLHEEVSWCLPWSMVFWEHSCVMALHSPACSRKSAPGERNGPRNLGRGQISDLPRSLGYRSCRGHRGWRRCGFSIQVWAAYGCPQFLCW